MGSHLFVLFILFDFTQYCKNFPFLQVAATLGIPLPAVSPPASCTPPAPILPGSRPPPQTGSDINSITLLNQLDYELNYGFALINYQAVEIE